MKLPSQSGPAHHDFLSLIGLVALALLVAGCRQSKDSADLFCELTPKIGLPAGAGEWPPGTFLTPEVTPGGVAVLDYDNDGDLDIYQVCHGPPGPDAFETPFPNRLYQQQADGSFVEVAAVAGVDDPGFGHGIAVGDMDNDGDLDLFVTNFGPNVFYLNNGDGTFTNATVPAGFSGAEKLGTARGVSGVGHWDSSAAFLDYDGDADLDLFVVRFANFNPEIVCKDKDGKTDYCGPHRFQGLPDALYRNNGDGTFSDVAADTGITKAGRGWGVVCTDITGDGRVDIYVSNDEQPNYLWVNQGDGTFVDAAPSQGVAFNGHGQTEASMGITVGDVDGDAQLDLFMTHFREETNTLYRAGKGSFVDHSANAGTAAIDLPYTGWGCGFLDFDHDGDLDLAVANGPVIRRPALEGASLGPFWNEYAEPNLLFQNDGTGRFANVSRHAGRLTTLVESSRGMAFGDLDHDGDLDLIVSNVDNMVRVFRNDAPKAGTHWLKVRAQVGPRDALGATVTLIAGDAEQRRWVRPVIAAYSYASSSEPVAHFGLGSLDRVEAAIVTWSNGQRERFTVGAVDRNLTVVQGKGVLESNDQR